MMSFCLLFHVFFFTYVLLLITMTKYKDDSIFTEVDVILLMFLVSATFLIVLTAAFKAGNQSKMVGSICYM